MMAPVNEAMFGCASLNKGPNTTCLLARCACVDGFCPVGMSSLGKWAQKCEPQVCLAGGIPTPQEHGLWQQIFGAGSPGLPPSIMNATNMTLDSVAGANAGFAFSVVIIPLLLLCCGCCGSCAMVYKLCIVGPLTRGIAEGTLVLEHVEHDEEGEPQSVTLRTGEYTKTIETPLACPMLCTSMCIVFLCVAIVGATAYPNLSMVLTRVGNTINDAYDDALLIADAGEQINQTAIQLEEFANFINQDCDFVKDYVLNGSTLSLSSYMDTVSSLHETMASLPELVGVGRNAFRTNEPMLRIAPIFPTVFIAFLAVGIVLEGLCVHCCASSSIGLEVDCTLRVASLCFACGIMLVALVSGIFIAASIVLSSACSDIDETTMNMVNLHSVTMGNQSETIRNITAHFIYGEGYNLLTESLQVSSKYLYDIQDLYADMKSKLGVVGFFIGCPITNKLNVELVVQRARKVLTNGLELISAKNIYPYYFNIARRGVCTDLINALGWIVVGQVLIGLVLFPICVILTHRYMVRNSVWEWAHSKEEHQVDSSDEGQTMLEMALNGFEDPSEGSPMLHKGASGYTGYAQARGGIS